MRDLVDPGVVLISGEEYGPGGPTFLFTKLNDLKPAMIAEATANARAAAEQFAIGANGLLQKQDRQACSGQTVSRIHNELPCW